MLSRLATSLCGVPLKNPVLAASGTYAYGVEFGDLLKLAALGGIVVKGLSREPMDGNPAPRIYETHAGMLNSIGLQNIGVRAFVAQKLPELAQAGAAVFANIFGYGVEDYVEVARVLEDAEGLAGYELNISCPNVKKGGMQFGSDPICVAEVVRAARKAAAKRPLWVKLSPLVTDIGLIARSAEEAGADALTVANTYPAMAVDFRSGKSRLGNPTGGLSGPAIKPITLKLVWETKKVVKTPIIGLGGIEAVEDVLEYLSVGASAVQVGTASFADPRASQRLVEDLTKVLFEAKLFTLSEIRDKFVAENG